MSLEAKKTEHVLESLTDAQNNVRDDQFTLKEVLKALTIKLASDDHVDSALVCAGLQQSFKLRSASILELQSRIRLTESFLKQFPEYTGQLQPCLMQARNCLDDLVRSVKVRIYGNQQFPFTAPSRASPYPGINAPADAESARMLSDEVLAPLWAALRAGETFKGSAAYRVVAFGGGLDGPFGIQYAKLPLSNEADEQYLLERYPKLILVSGAGRIYFEFYALDEEKKHFIEYQQVHGSSSGTMVPMPISHVRNQMSCVPYYLGNVFGLRGIGMKIWSDRPELAMFGGLESSTVYNTLVAEAGITTQLLLARDLVMSASELLTFVRRSARNELQDTSMGGQGVLSSISDGPTINYFVAGYPAQSSSSSSKGPTLCSSTTVFQTPLPEAAESVPWLERNCLLLNPGVMILNGKRMNERYGHYTSYMMYTLAKIGHVETLKNIQGMNAQVNEIQSALLTKNITSLVNAVNGYTDARITAQTTFLTILASPEHHLYEAVATECKDKPYIMTVLVPKARAILLRKDITKYDQQEELRCIAPYVGAHYPFLVKARSSKYNLAAMPLGAGGNGVHWQLFGTQDALQAFIQDEGYTSITTESVAKARQNSVVKPVEIKGVITAHLNSGPAMTMLSTRKQQQQRRRDQKEPFIQLSCGQLSSLKAPWVTLNQTSGTLTLLTDVALTPKQQAAHEMVVQRLQLTGMNAKYLWCQTIQYNAQKMAQMKTIIYDPNNVSPNANVRLTSCLSRQEKRELRGEIPVESVMTDENMKMGQDTELIIVKLLAGVGQRLKRIGLLRMLARMRGDQDPENVQMATKGFDLGRFECHETDPNTWRYVSIGDMTIRQLISMKSSGDFAHVTFWPVVNNQSKPDYMKLLQGKYEDHSDEKSKIDKYCTRQEALENAGVSLRSPLVQRGLPPLIASTGQVDTAADAKLAPGGTGFCGMALLHWLWHTPNQDTCRVLFIGNGENPGMITSALAGHVRREGWLFAQLEVTTSEFDTSASRCGLRRVTNDPNGPATWMPCILESREIAQLPLADRMRVQTSGQRNGFGILNQQTHNSNCFVINGDLVHKTLDTLAKITSTTFVEKLISADFIVRPAVHDRLPVDGALTTQFHRIHNFLAGGYVNPMYALSSSQLKRIQTELPSKALCFIVYPPEKRSDIYYINKTVASAWFFMTNRFILSSKTGCISDATPLRPLAQVSISTADGFYHDVSQFLAAFGLAATKDAHSITVSGQAGVICTASVVTDINQPVELQCDVTFMGNVRIINATTNIVNLRKLNQTQCYPELSALFDHTGMLTLSDVQLEITSHQDQMKITVVHLSPAPAVSVSSSSTMKADNNPVECKL